jgi:predicted nucleic acid-binding Zn ribbon protein
VPAEADHRHCKVCGKVCGVGEETCSRACREKRAAQMASRRNYQYLLYAAIAILLLVFLSSVIR